MIFNFSNILLREHTFENVATGSNYQYSEGCTWLGNGSWRR